MPEGSAAPPVGAERRDGDRLDFEGASGNTFMDGSAEFEEPPTSRETGVSRRQRVSGSGTITCFEQAASPGVSPADGATSPSGDDPDDRDVVGDVDFVFHIGRGIVWDYTSRMGVDGGGLSPLCHCLRLLLLQGRR